MAVLTEIRLDRCRGCAAIAGTVDVQGYCRSCAAGRRSLGFYADGELCYCADCDAILVADDSITCGYCRDCVGNHPEPVEGDRWSPRDYAFSGFVVGLWIWLSCEIVVRLFPSLLSAGGN